MEHTVTYTDRCIQRLCVQQASAATDGSGKGKAKPTFESILCVRFARGMESTFKLRWLTISNHTEETQNYSGTEPIGAVFVKNVTIKKQDVRIASRLTGTEPVITGGAVIILKMVKYGDRRPPFRKFSQIRKGGLIPRRDIFRKIEQVFIISHISNRPELCVFLFQKVRK